MKMKKVIILLSILIVAAIGIFGYIVIFDMFGDDTTNESPDNQEEEPDKEAGEDRKTIGGNVTDEELAEYEEEGKNPFGEKIALEELNDASIQEYIHGMSHQKVVAEAKWGYYELKPSRVEWLLEGVEEASDLDHKQTYKNILNKWKNGDFSSVDEDHNQIWQLQEGTVGKATGILSDEEEEAYINSQESQDDEENEENVE